jgi:hypothetical protein
MTTADLVFLGGQFHFSIDKAGKIEQAHFVARIGRKAPVEVTDPEVRAAFEEKRVENVEIRINKSNTLLDGPVASLVPKAKDIALARFAPAGTPVDAGGEIL